MLEYEGDPYYLHIYTIFIGKDAIETPAPERGIHIRVEYLSELKKAIALAEEQIAKGREVMEGEREDLADIAGTPRQK